MPCRDPALSSRLTMHREWLSIPEWNSYVSITFCNKQQCRRPLQEAMCAQEAATRPTCRLHAAMWPQEGNMQLIINH